MTAFSAYAFSFITLTHSFQNVVLSFDLLLYGVLLGHELLSRHFAPTLYLLHDASYQIMLLTVYSYSCFDDLYPPGFVSTCTMLRVRELTPLLGVAVSVSAASLLLYAIASSLSSRLENG